MLLDTFVNKSVPIFLNVKRNKISVQYRIYFILWNPEPERVNYWYWCVWGWQYEQNNNLIRTV